MTKLSEGELNIYMNDTACNAGMSMAKELLQLRKDKASDAAGLQQGAEMIAKLYERLRAAEKVIECSRNVDAIYDVCDGTPGNGPSHGRLGPWADLHAALEAYDKTNV